MNDKLKKRVHQALIDHTGARQSDNILMTILWSDDLYHLDAKDKTRTAVFFRLFMEGKLTNMASAKRVRRELQQKHPELRDPAVYDARHKIAEDYNDHYSSRYNFLGRK